MNLTFRNAVFLSLLAHSAIFLPSFNFVFNRQQITEKKDSIIVDYIREKEPQIEFKKIEDVRKKPAETQKIPVVTKVDTVSKSVPAANTPVKSLKDVADALAVKQAKVMSTKDYINYYTLIREKIRRRLKDKYRSYYSEGDAYLIFFLRSDGSLISAGVDPDMSTRDRILLDTAIQSVKEAAPFAPFPKAITLQQMSFTLTVSFKKQ